MKRDKVYHFVAGIIIAVLSISALKFTELNMLWAVVPVILIGAAKELIWDKWMKRGCAEWMDFVWTCIGGILTVLLFIL